MTRREHADIGHSGVIVPRLVVDSKGDLVNWFRIASYQNHLFRLKYMKLPRATASEIAIMTG